MFNKIKQKIKAYIIKKAVENKVVDVVEVRTQSVGLTSVITETDIRIRNSFFLPIKLISIKSDLLNKEGLKIGKMYYHQPQKIKGNSDIIVTTTSEISIITSIFQAISQLLAHSITMHSVGVSEIKILWFTIEVPVNDFFEIHPSKIKITKEETEEELKIRKEKEAILREKYNKQRASIKEKRKIKRANWKEDILKRRYKENYIPKEQRAKSEEKTDLQEGLEITINENAFLQEEEPVKPKPTPTENNTETEQNRINSEEEESTTN